MATEREYFASVFIVIVQLSGYYCLAKNEGFRWFHYFFMCNSRFRVVHF